MNYRLKIQQATTTLILFVVFFLLVQAPRASDSRIIEVDHATVIAFFPPVSKSDLESDNDLNEALLDFQWHLNKAKPLLESKGIRVVELYVKEFSYLLDGKPELFRIQDVGVGYFMIAPGRKPQTDYGVMTDADLLSVAEKYFEMK